MVAREPRLDRCQEPVRGAPHCGRLAVWARGASKLTLAVRPSGSTTVAYLEPVSKITAAVDELRGAGVTAEVIVKKPGEVPRSLGKAVRVRDLRPKEA